MKKFLAILLFVFLLGFLAACGGEDNEESQEDSKSNEESTEESSEGNAEGGEWTPDQNIEMVRHQQEPVVVGIRLPVWLHKCMQQQLPRES